MLVVAKSTVAVLSVVPVRDTVTSTVLSLSLMLVAAALKAMTALSLVRMVSVKLVSVPRAVLVGVRNRTRNASEFSATMSFRTVTVNVLLVSPAAKETSPFVET